MSNLQAGLAHKPFFTVVHAADADLADGTGA
jgi:hypothetical protein